MIKNIIFDWSGTLSNDLTPVYTATMNVFKKLGLRILSLEEYKREFTLPYMEFYKKFRNNINKEEVDKLFFKEINSVNEPKPFPKVKAILKFLETKEVKMSLLSSHPQKKLEKEIKDYGFQKFFVEINGSVHNKVETILEIMERNGFESNETAYVWDMTHDIEAGKKAGVITVAVSWGYQPKEKLLKEIPDFLIKDIEELKEILYPINKTKNKNLK
ncbi:MAG: HAD family hydrolase [Candidatus Nanoarchaeia archaeon]|nr:HAD family hydrolase [Candidatus Nanoarchaeia archaeon]MDD5741463.1 HAD family hydrolase [Candidatus Nanoarchaeia archaeon]